MAGVDDKETAIRLFSEAVQCAMDSLKLYYKVHDLQILTNNIICYAILAC